MMNSNQYQNRVIDRDIKMINDPLHKLLPDIVWLHLVPLPSHKEETEE